MATKSTNNPWDEYHGMTEGDMVDELVERDYHLFREHTREWWEACMPSYIRYQYWLEIGRWNTTEDSADET